MVEGWADVVCGRGRQAVVAGYTIQIPGILLPEIFIDMEVFDFQNVVLYVVLPANLIHVEIRPKRYENIENIKEANQAIISLFKKIIRFQ